MKIDITSLNRKVFKIALKECVDRDKWAKNQFKEQIEDDETYGDPEGFKETYQKYLNMEVYFNELIKKIRRNKFIEISDEQIEYMNHMIEDQLYISKERINDWQSNGKMYAIFKSRFIEENPKKNIKEFENCVKEIIKYDEDLIIFCNKFSKLLNNKNENE